MNYRKKEVEVLESFDVRVKEYVNGRIELVIYDRKINKIKSGYELSDKEEVIKSRTDSKQRRDDANIRQDSINRSYRLMVDYAIQNAHHFKSFITLTFKENIKDMEQANKMFSNWVRQIKRQKKDFIYLGAPEFQKRGAVHYHIMTNIEIEQNDLIIKQHGTDKMYDVKYWNHGYSSVFDLALTDDKFSVASYLSKYYFKDIDDRLFGHKKVLKSNNLSKPTVKTMESNTNEYQNYIMYLTKSKELQNKKSVQTENKYAPNMTILTFN